MQPSAKPRSNTRSLAEEAGWLRRRAEPHNTIDTTRLSGDTQRPPPPPPGGGPSSGVADGQPRAHSVLLSKGRGRGGKGGGPVRCVHSTRRPREDGLRCYAPSDVAPAKVGTRKRFPVTITEIEQCVSKRRYNSLWYRLSRCWLNVLQQLRSAVAFAQGWSLCGGFVRRTRDLLLPNIVFDECIKSVAWPAR